MHQLVRSLNDLWQDDAVPDDDEGCGPCKTSQSSLIQPHSSQPKAAYLSR